MRKRKSTQAEARALNSEKSTFKDSEKLSDSQLIEIENRDKIIEKRKLIFDLVFSIGMAVLIIHLILQW